MSAWPNFVASAVAAPVAPVAAAPNARSARRRRGARSARLKRFEREQVVVDYLNRGVSVVEITARIGVGEKRMRAVIRDILARRMPHPPAEFVAIQVSRLNEALLVAYSAMSPTNLKAVDEVVKIVRELDRYGGAFVAEWARPEASGRDAPSEEDAGRQDVAVGTRTPSSRTTTPSSPRSRPSSCPESGQRNGREPRPGAPPLPTGRARRSSERARGPGNSAQGLEKAQFAPGCLLRPDRAGARPDGRTAPVGTAGVASLPDRPRSQGEAERGGEGPEIPAQGLEKAHFAPGFSSLAPTETGTRPGGRTATGGRRRRRIPSRPSALAGRGRARRRGPGNSGARP